MADDEAADLRGIVVSPGPGDPESAGVSVDTIKVAADRGIPLLGVCLGMQSMARRVRRGRSSARRRSSTARRPRSSHDGEGLLAGMPADFPAARYHSLCVDPATLPGRTCT